MSVPHPSPSPDRSSLELLVDGHLTDILDVSPEQALVLTTVLVKPDQRVRVVMRAPGSVLRVQARVLTAKFEMPKEGPRYRVALTFEGDTSAIAEFLT